MTLFVDLVDNRHIVVSIWGLNKAKLTLYPIYSRIYLYSVCMRSISLSRYLLSNLARNPAGPAPYEDFCAVLIFDGGEPRSKQSVAQASHKFLHEIKFPSIAFEM